MSNATKVSRLLVMAAFVISAIIFHTTATFAQHPCDAFVNTCNIPSFTSWTVNDTIVTSTGQAGEPVAHSFYTTAQNPLQTNWYHWTAPQNGMIVVNTQGTNPNALPPNYHTPLVMDIVIAAYTGATLGTLTRVDESDDWQPSSPPNCSCTFPRTFPESIFSSCMMFTVTAGTTYRFQIDHLSEANPANNDFVLNMYYRAPTSSSVWVSGKVTDGSGNGIGKARVSLTDAAGGTVTALTNPFGYYRFDAEAGRTYFLQAESKRFQFLNNPRILTVSEDLLNEDFVAVGQVALPDRK